MRTVWWVRGWSSCVKMSPVNASNSDGRIGWMVHYGMIYVNETRHSNNSLKIVDHRPQNRH